MAHRWTASTFFKTVLSLPIFLVLLVSAQADSGLSREALIEQKLQCAALQAEHPQDINWVEVCDLGDPKPVGDGREELIDSEMNRVSRRINANESQESVGLSTPVYEQSNTTEHGIVQVNSGIVSLKNDDPATFKKQEFEISPETYYYKYTEVIGVKDTGMKVGISANYTIRLFDNEGIYSWKDIISDSNKINVLRIENRFSYGLVNYEGSGTVKSIPDYNYEGRILVGYDIPVKYTARFTPYFGFGIRYLFNQFSTAPAQTVDGVDYLSGYDRESRYLYMPLGGEFEAKLSENWFLGLKGEFDWFLSGKQWSHFEDMEDSSGTNAGYDLIANDQKAGKGFRLSLKLKYDSQKRFSFFIEPFVRYWHIRDSEVSFITAGGDLVCTGNFCLVGTEPDNKTWEYGAAAGISF